MKVVLSGIAAATAAGMLLGGAMQPHLGVAERPAGPQMIAGWAGVRGPGPIDPGTALAYSVGRPPDYLFGTDWKRTPALPHEVEAAAPSPRREVAHTADPVEPSEPPGLTRLQDAPPAPSYPSLGSDLPTRAPIGQAVDAASETTPAGDH